MWLQFVQCDLQHDFAWVADEADRSVVLVLLQVAYLGSVMTRDWVHGVASLLSARSCCRLSSDR